MITISKNNFNILIVNLLRLLIPCVEKDRSTTKNDRSTKSTNLLISPHPYPQEKKKKENEKIKTKKPLNTEANKMFHPVKIQTIFCMNLTPAENTSD